MTIKIDDVSKRFGNFCLEHISLELPAGYICGLAGRNGAGKTTLLHLLTGLYRADAGQILIDNMSYDDDEVRIHDNIGTVFVEELFEPAYSIRGNAEQFGRYYARYRWERMAEYLERFRLDAGRKFGKLSKGAEYFWNKTGSN